MKYMRKYRRGEDILLGCYCSPKESCHGDIIHKLQGILKERKKLLEAKKVKKRFGISK